MPAPERVRALAERLIAIPSVSPDPAAETECARALVGLLPTGLEHGEWLASDGRPVVWALLRGRSTRTVVLLGHYDTVGVSAFAALSAPDGTSVAFDGAALSRRLLQYARAAAATVAPEVLVDLEEEASRPGAWMFGRGALDMKSGLAAGIAALDALAWAPDSLDGSVLFIATPDEEHESRGMTAAVPELVRLRDARGLELLGVLNLDYCLEPAVYLGAVGKLQMGCYVLGTASHVGDPSRGADALSLAAAIVNAVAEGRDLIDTWEAERGVPPVALKLNDLKVTYSIEPSTEVVAEFNVIVFARPLARTMDLFHGVVARALEESERSRAELAEWRGTTGASGAGALNAGARVLVYPDLKARALEREGDVSVPSVPSVRDARSATLDRVRRLCRAAGVSGPAVILYLLPPYYPHAAPGNGPLSRAARAIAEEEGIALRSFYPFISDASYVAWRDEGTEEIARYFPALGREYALPVEASRALDLEVVNLGPWGRDAHGLFERVNAPYAFERLPRLIARMVQKALEQ